MASLQVIETPGGIAFSGFYYPELLREVLNWLRQNKDYIGLTDENQYEVHVQLVKAFCLMGHLSNTRLDTVATELFLDPAQLLQSVKEQLRLVGIELASATPATATLLCKLSEVTTLNQTEFIPALAEFTTNAVPPITFEASSNGVDLNATHQVSYVYGLEEEDSGTAGSVSANAPGTFQRTTGTWGTGALTPVGTHLFLVGSNSGEYRVTERLNDTDIKVIAIPSNDTPSFVSETNISWSLKRFTANQATEANSLGVYFSPWSVVHVGDLFYVGHAQIIHTQLDFTFNTVGSGITGVWEYFDNEESEFNPDSVTDLGSTLEFDLTALLGTSDRRGTEVTVTYLQTGAQETVTSVYAGGINKITTSGLLGQVSASTALADYHVTADWIPFNNQQDNTVDSGSVFGKAGSVEWELPQNDERSWLETNVNLVTGYWLRFRVIAVSTPTAPSIDRILITEGDQYLTFSVTQGETIGPQIIGSSTGQAYQEHLLSETPYIDNTETIEVDEGGAGTWTEYEYVTTFLYSRATDRHYRREVDATDTAKIIFGNGSRGRIPPVGINNIRATYRVGGDESGNVGQDQIVVNAEGISGITSVTNPRSATGWRIKDGGNDTDLARVKREKPAELTIRGTASRPEDTINLAINSFVDSNGSKPVARAWAVEEGYGVKTIKLIVVGNGGTTLTSTQLNELEEYFNGDRYQIPPVEGVLLMNHTLTAINFEPALISVTATVSWTGGSAEQIINQLLSYLTPLAKESDGTTYVWTFGSQVSYSRVHALIHAVDPNITDIPVLTINGVSDSYNLSANALPVTTAASITVTVQDS